MKLPLIFNIGSSEVNRAILCLTNQHNHKFQIETYNFYFQKFQEFINYFENKYTYYKTTKPKNILIYNDFLKTYQLPTYQDMFNHLRTLIIETFTNTGVVNFTLFSMSYLIIFGYLLLVEQNPAESSYDEVKGLIGMGVYNKDLSNSDFFYQYMNFRKTPKTIPFFGKLGVYGFNVALNAIINYDCKLIGFNTNLYPVHSGRYKNTPFDHARHDTGHAFIIDNNLNHFGKDKIKHVYNRIIESESEIKIELALHYLFMMVHEFILEDHQYYADFYTFIDKYTTYAIDFDDLIRAYKTKRDWVDYLKLNFNYDIPERLLSLDEMFAFDECLIKYKLSHRIFGNIDKANIEIVENYLDFNLGHPLIQSRRKNDDEIRQLIYHYKHMKEIVSEFEETSESEQLLLIYSNFAYDARTEFLKVID